jgi:hypothetical protein
VGVIGDTLSEARSRRAVDLEQVHAATGIRPRYLEAIEQEDWDALPEDFYARSFIRKYAQFLGVDPEPLVEEYRRRRGGGEPGEAPTSPFARTKSRRAEALRRRRKRQAVYTWVLAGALLAAVVAGIVLLSTGGGGGSKQANGTGAGGQGKTGGKHGGGTGGGNSGGQGKAGRKHAGGKGSAAGAGAAVVSLKIEPTAEVWACVLDAQGKPLVDGQTLAEGEAVGPFKSHAYTAAFGNGSVQVLVDGKRVHTPSTPSPMGFRVDRQGDLKSLPEGKRPSCE